MKKQDDTSLSAGVNALVLSGETILENLYMPPYACEALSPQVLPDGFPMIQGALRKMLFVVNDDTFKNLLFTQHENTIAYCIKELETNVNPIMTQYVEFVYSPHLAEGVLYVPKMAFWVTQAYNEIVFAMYNTRRENDPWIGC